jgi:hypothetical protein
MYDEKTHSLDVEQGECTLGYVGTCMVKKRFVTPNPKNKFPKA